MFKRRVNYIFSKQIKYYTKETLKLTNIIAIGVFIIIGILLINMKPVYEISLNGETIGYIENRKHFEETIYKTFNDNKEENIAFADFEKETKYKFKLIDRQNQINEAKVIEILKENADITYFQYAVCANGEEKQTFSSMEQANEVIENIRKNIKGEVELSVKRVYTKQLKIEEEYKIANICDDLIVEINNQIKEEKRKEKSTINGVYIAVVPVQGNVTSRYGAREEIRDHEHKGLDIAAKTGTPIKAAADGTISFSGTMGGYGNLIIIDHGNGITTYYGHCNKLYKAKGTKVTAGDVIAEVGSTGNSTGSHLHFEIRKNGVYINPSKYLF